MKFDPIKLKTITWIAALFYALFVVFIIFALFALSAPPWTLGDILLTIALGGSYVFGLLIGRKWPLTGGVMSLVSPIILLAFDMGLKADAIGLSLGVLIMMIPGCLYLLSWYLQRKHEAASENVQNSNGA